MKKIIAVAALFTVLSTSAFAAGNNAYVTADLSKASYSNASPFPNPKKFGIGVGYQATPNVAAEVGYHKFGDSTVTAGAVTQTLKVSSLTVAAVGNYPINDQFSAIGKLGIAMNKLSGTGNYTDSSNSLYFAVGGQYNINQQFAVRAQYENFGDITSLGGSGPGQATASAFGIAGVINF